jgi:anti-repressor protein
MTALALFESESFSVRSITIDGEPWFVAADVCNALEIANNRDALTRLDADDVGSTDTIDSIGRTQTSTIVNEPGLYTLALGSRKPEAKKFKRWITHDVIPAIRRTGTYSVAPQWNIPTTLAGALQLAADQARQIDQQTARIAELEPAAAFADTLSGTGNDYSLREAAQVLDRDPAIRTGRNRLLNTLKAIGWVDRTGQPYQGQVDNGRLVRKLSTWRDEQRIIHTEVTVRVTAKGLRALHERLGGVSTLALITQPPLAVGFPDGITA